MKKVMFSLLVVSLSFVACKKDRDCECTTTTNGVSTTTVSKIKDTKSKAEKTCKDRTSGATTCKLK